MAKIEEQHVAATARWVSLPGNPLSAEDLPLASPLTFRVLDEAGTLLLDTGAVLDEARRTQLFRYFKPHRQRDDAAPNDPAPPSTVAAADGTTSVAAPDQETGGAAAAAKAEGRPAAAAPGKAGATAQGAPVIAGVVGLDDDADRTRRAIGEMALSIGTRLGIRLPMGNGGVAYASRLIGVAPHGPLFVVPPVLDQSRLELNVGETVEVVAVCPLSIYLFACTVEWVSSMPFPFLVLSPPARVRKLRERRAIRTPSRLAVLYAKRAAGSPVAAQKTAAAPSVTAATKETAAEATTAEGTAAEATGATAASAASVAPTDTTASSTTAAPTATTVSAETDASAGKTTSAAAPVAPPSGSAELGLGVAIDLSTVGMSLATDQALGEVGDRLNVSFYVEAEGVPIAVEADCGIRSIKARKSKEGDRGEWVHGLAFGPLPPTQRLVLKSYVLSLRVERDRN